MLFTRLIFQIITQNKLTEHNVNYVTKKDNPPIVPQAGPIEECWALGTE